MPENQNTPAPIDDTTRQQLILAAQAGRANAYAPYSGYRVGAALLTESGEIVTGCNVENVAYGPSICAERTAVVKAVSEGHRSFAAVAVVTQDAISPCGVCRQVLAEFSPGMTVIMADAEGRVHHECTVADLLPLRVGADGLSGLPHHDT